MTTDNSAAVPASVADDEKSVVDMEDWLRQNVVIQYWKGECEHRPSDVCRFSNIAVDWFVFRICDNITFNFSLPGTIFFILNL